MRTFTSLIIATAAFAGINFAASPSPPLGLSCLINPTNNPAGSPPTSCAQSPIPITFETCASSCTCNTNGTVSCNGLDSTCTGELLTQACDGYWGCECVPPCICPNGEPCSTGCGVGLGHPPRVDDGQEPVGSTAAPIKGRHDAEQSGEDPSYDIFCPNPTTNTVLATCGQLEVTYEICLAYLGDSTCTCTTSGALSCSTVASGCSDEALAEICAQFGGCGCEADAGCFCDPPANTVPCSAFGGRRGIEDFEAPGNGKRIVGKDSPDPELSHHRVTFSHGSHLVALRWAVDDGAGGKTPPTSNLCTPNPEGATRGSSSRVIIRGSHNYSGGAENTKGGVGLAKDALRHRHKHRHREHGSGHEEGRHHRSHKHSREVSRPRTASSEVAPQAVLGAGNEIPGFIEDRKGDQYNVTYGSVHRYSIPRYRTAGHRRVVGLGRTHKILQNSDGNTRILGEDPVDSGVRLKAQSLLAGNVDWKKAPIQVVPESTNTQSRVAELQCDFLSLSAHDSRKRRRLEALESFHAVSHDHSQGPEQSSADRELLSQRRALSESGTDTSDSDISSSSSKDDSFEQFRKNARQQKTVELSRAVHDRPQDIEAWLALINYQDSVLDKGDGTMKAPTNAEKYGLADVKISIYETALSKNASNPERDRLVIGLMEEGFTIWDSKKLGNQWRSVLKENAHVWHLWIKYLDFEQSNFLTFSYDQCKSVYAECLRVIATQALDRKQDELRIYVLLRLTSFMRDAGYSEHAVGLWQAMLEYNYFQPDVAEGRTKVSSFEDFWNSEVARIGEEDARGWKSGLSPDLAPTSDTSNLLVDPARIFQSWPDCERERMLNASLPARTLDEVNDDDPYRVIISLDVSEYLFNVTDPEMKMLLLSAFLLFCGLPPFPSHGQPPEQHWWTDGFLRDFKPSLTHAVSDSNLHQNIPMASPITSLVTDTSTMFADTEHWFSCWQDNRNLSSVPRMSRFQRLALRQLVDATPTNQHLAEYVVAYQLTDDAKEARKLAKALLKQRPSNLRLYNAYALVECRLGNIEAAERVWSTALSMSRTFADSDRQDAILLWRTWIWQLLDRAESRKAFALLLAIPKGQADVDKLSEQSQSVSHDVHATAILKARRTLESNLAHANSLHHSDLIVHYTDLLALLAYFTSTDSLTGALAVYTTILDPPTSPPPPPPFTSNTSSTPPETELLHQSRARLLHLHTSTPLHSKPMSGFRPAQITTPLSSSLRLFPANSIFQTLYHHHTQHSLVTDRIRTVIPTLHTSSTNPAAPKNSITPSVFDIWSEMTRPSYAGSTRHSIRAAFERAVDVASGKAGAHSPAVWTWYLRWELSVSDPTHDAKLSRAQNIFYRGMRACPGAKAFYMIALTEPRLREAIGFRDLRRIYETTVEKGLRIHVDLGEILEHEEKADRETATNKSQAGCH